MNPVNHLAFAGLFFAISLCRGILLSVIPLQALGALGDAQQVSVLFFSVSIVGVGASLCMSLVVRLLGSYHAFLIGVYAMALCAPLLAMDSLWGLLLGMLLHVCAIASLEVTTSLYVMHCIKRQALGRFEPIRVLAVVLALTIGPYLGVYLESRVSHTLPFVVTAAAALASFVYFRALGLHRQRLLQTSSTGSNPLRSIRKYFSQPRLRLAWGLCVARSCWWVTFIIYTPIYMLTAGAGELMGAAVVSIGSAGTLTVPFWGWVGRRHGLRFLLRLGFLVTGALSLLVYVFAADTLLTAGLLVVTALGASILDGAGNVLFFRAVRTMQRAEMTGVFLTYRDLSALAPPGVFAVLLKFFALPAVFAVAAGWMFASVFFSRYIPRRM